MTDFSHLNSLRIKDDATQPYTFYRIGGEPTLDCRPAHESNREFFNAALKASKQASRRTNSRKGATPTQETIDAARKEDIRLFALCVVTGWSGVQDSKGNEVEFSRENVEAFLSAIPSDMFTELRAFCLDIDNYRDVDEMDIEEFEELSGN